MARGARRAPCEPAPHHRHARRHRARFGGAATTPGPQRTVPVRPAQPVPGQRRGGPPPVGDGLSAAPPFRPRRPRGGRGAARAPLGRPEQPAHSRRLQRDDAGLAELFHVHLLHRPRRQVPAVCAGREQLRSAGAHDEVHADRGSAPHVRRRVGRLARDPAHLRGDEPARHRRPGQAARRWCDRLAYAPALPQLPLQRHHRPVRRRPVEQCSHLLQLGPERPFRGEQAQRRSPAQGRQLQGPASGGQPAARDRGADAQRAQRGAARRLHQGLGGRRRALEQGDREGRHCVPSEGSAQGIPPADRHPGRHQGLARTAAS